MHIRLMIFNIILLIGCDVLMTVAMAEDNDNKPSSEVEISENETELDIANDTKLVTFRKKNKSVPKQNKRSFKMIVGGQSEDGLAKQVTVPIKD